MRPCGDVQVVADKGYHSNDVLMKLEEVEVRSYIPEPKRGRRNWKNKHAERDAVRRNQRRIKRAKGTRLGRPHPRRGPVRRRERRRRPTIGVSASSDAAIAASDVVPED